MFLPLQLVERVAGVLGPDDRQIGAGQHLLRVGALGLGTADVENGFHGRGDLALTGAKWPSPAESTSRLALPFAP